MGVKYQKDCVLREFFSKLCTGGGDQTQSFGEKNWFDIPEGPPPAFREIKPISIENTSGGLNFSRSLNYNQISDSILRRDKAKLHPCAARRWSEIHFEKMILM